MAKGRKKGGLSRGSMAWHVAKLDVGEVLLVADRPSYKNWQASIVLTLDRAKKSGALTGEFTVRTCIGHRHDLSERPFRFFEITREE